MCIRAALVLPAKYWKNRKAKAEQNAGIIVAHSSKNLICLISYNSYA